MVRVKIQDGPAQHEHKRHNHNHHHHHHHHVPPSDGAAPLPPTPPLAAAATRKEARAVLAAYGDFWTQLRFRKGWSCPPFSREAVLPMLERAADVVACIRTQVLDREDPGFKLRMIDGSAREFLHGCDYVPMDDPDRFTIDLIHATLQDGKGYVEGLTRERVDHYIRTFTRGDLLPLLPLPPPPPQQQQQQQQQAQPPPAVPSSASVVSSAAKGEEEQPQQQGGMMPGGGGGSWEGASLSRVPSVVRDEALLHEGVVARWAALTHDMEVLMGQLGEGKARGHARRLLALRRVLVDLEATGAHVRELLQDITTTTTTTPPPPQEGLGGGGMAATTEEGEEGEQLQAAAATATTAATTATAPAGGAAAEEEEEAEEEEGMSVVEEEGMSVVEEEAAPPQAAAGGGGGGQKEEEVVEEGEQQQEPEGGEEEMEEVLQGGPSSPTATSPPPPATTTTTPPPQASEEEGEQPPTKEEGEAAQAAVAEEEAAAAATSSNQMEEEEGTKDKHHHQHQESGAIKIQKVADDVSSLKDQIHHLTECVQGLDSKALASPTCSVSGERVLEALQGRCAKFSQALLHGLNVLDDLHEVEDKDKPLRKNQVLQIQQLIDDVEAMRERLRVLRAQVPPSTPTTAASTNNKTPQQQDEQQQQRRQQEASSSPPPPTMEEDEEVVGQGPLPVVVGALPSSLPDLSRALEPLWRRMKMRPRLEWLRQPHSYILQSFIPGMKLADLQVTVGPSGVLTLKGYRGPSLQDLAVLRQRVHPRAPIEAMLQAGADRFGSFVETTRLPKDADLEGLEASYDEGGVLRVTIPRHLHHRLPPQQASPFFAHPHQYQQQQPGGWLFGGQPYHHSPNDDEEEEDQQQQAIPPRGRAALPPQPFSSSSIYPKSRGGGGGGGCYYYPQGSSRGAGGAGGFWGDPDVWW